MIAEKISISQQENINKKPSETLKLTLPSIQVDKLLSSLPVSQIKISSIDAFIDGFLWQANDLLLNLNNPKKVTASIKLSEKAPWLKIGLLNIQATKQDNLWLLDAKLNDLSLLQLSYQNNDQQRSLLLTTWAENLVEYANKNLPNLPSWMNNPNWIQGKAVLKLTQNSNDEQATINGELRGAIYSPEQTGKQKLEYQVNLSQLAESQLHLKANAFSDSQVLWQHHKIDAPNIFLSANLTLPKGQDFTNLVISKINASISSKKSRLLIADNHLAISKFIITASHKDFSITNFNSETSEVIIELVSSDISLQSPNLSPAINAQLKGQLKLSSFTSPNVNGNIQLNNINWGDNYSSLDKPLKINLRGITPDLTSGDFDLYFDELDNRIMSLDYQRLEVDIEGRLSEKSITANGKININDQPVTNVDMQYLWLDGQMQSSIARQPITKDLLNQLAAIAVPAETAVIDLQAGDFSYQSEIQFANQLAVSGKANLLNGQLAIDENIAEQVSFEGTLKSIEPLVGSGMLKAETIILSSGLEIKNLSADLTINSVESINFESLTMQVLGASIHAKQMLLENAQLAPTIVYGDHLSLTEIVFFLAVDDLYAEGIVDIKLPLQSDGDALVIKQGSFTSKGNGLIKYGALSALQQTDNIALQALANFHYTQLDGTIDYDKYGEYQLKLHFLGANPDLYDGYPVDFVLNLKGKLPGIFKSLFLSGNFEESILESVKAQNKSKP